MTVVQAAIRAKSDGERAGVKRTSVARTSINGRKNFAAERLGVDRKWEAMRTWDARLLSVGITGNDAVARYFHRKQLRGHPITYRERVWRFLYEPSSSVAGLVWASLVAILIVAATIICALRARPAQSLASGEVSLALLGVDSAIGVIFAVEVLLRCVTSPTVRWVATDVLLWLDVVLLAPTCWRAVSYPREPSPIGLACVLEALGPLRLFKAARFVHFAQLLREALLRSLAGLGVMLFFFLLVCLTCGSLVYAGDVMAAAASSTGGTGGDADDALDADDDDAPVGAGGLDMFEHWLMVATLTTVGWVPPDFEPKSLGARLGMVLASVLGLPVIAIALTVVGDSFDDVCGGPTPHTHTVAWPTISHTHTGLAYSSRISAICGGPTALSLTHSGCRSSAIYLACVCACTLLFFSHAHAVCTLTVRAWVGWYRSGLLATCARCASGCNG